MKQAAAISFRDAVSGDGAFVGVRHDDNKVAISLSLMTGGDIEVSMSKETGQGLAKALEIALK